MAETFEVTELYALDEKAAKDPRLPALGVCECYPCRGFSSKDANGNSVKCKWTGTYVQWKYTGTLLVTETKEAPWYKQILSLTTLPPEVVSETSYPFVGGSGNKETLVAYLGEAPGGYGP